MFAVIKTGGKQYRVANGDVIRVERLDYEPGAIVKLGSVLAIDDGGGVKVGTPVLDGAEVTAEVVEQARGPKIIVFKKKRRQQYRRKKGHRQDLTVLKIRDVLGGDAAAEVALAKTDETSAEASPVEASPVDTAPVEVAPVEVAPVEVAPVEVAPVEVAPVEVAPDDEAITADALAETEQT